MRRAVLRMIYRKLSMAFNAWAEWYADMLEQERRLRRALYSWNANGMMWAFTWWRTGRFENVLDLHSKAAAFWLNREMGMAWRTWHEKYCKFKEMRDLLARLEARHQREKEALLQEIERLRKLIMDRELKRQADWDDDDRKLAHALKMMQNRALAAAFNKLKYEAQMARENNGHRPCAQTLAEPSYGCCIQHVPRDLLLNACYAPCCYVHEESCNCSCLEQLDCND